MNYDEILKNATPRPWRHGYDGKANSSVIHGPNGQVAQALGNLVDPIHARTDAAYIVLAVNAHEAMYKALLKAKSTLEWLSNCDGDIDDAVMTLDACSRPSSRRKGDAMKQPYQLFGSLYLTCHETDYSKAHIWLTRQVHQFRQERPDPWDGIDNPAARLEDE